MNVCVIALSRHCLTATFDICTIKYFVSLSVPSCLRQFRMYRSIIPEVILLPKYKRMFNIGSQNEAAVYYLVGYMYDQYDRDCASRDSIVTVMAAFCTSETLSGAKCLLWSYFEDSNLLEPMQTRLTSCTRTDRKATSDDILRGIGSLVENRIKVQCVAREWKLIPESHPDGVNVLTLAEKLADPEGKLKVLVDSLDGTKSDAATNSQKISALEADSKLHGQLIQQVLVKTNDHNAKYPSLAEAVAGGSSTWPPQKTGGTNRDGAPDGNDNDQCERKQEADRESQPIPVPPRIDSTTQQLHDTFVIPSDQRRKQKKQQSQKENSSKQPPNT